MYQIDYLLFYINQLMLLMKAVFIEFLAMIHLYSNFTQTATMC
nr:MAG TPA: hypothetical protein [Caudoviricetes sp.]